MPKNVDKFVHFGNSDKSNSIGRSGRGLSLHNTAHSNSLRAGVKPN
jgi:hypothetical protein